METISQWLLTFLSNALWQAPVIAAAAACCDRLMRNASGRQRHFLWVAALVLCALLPLLGAAGPLREVAQTPAAREMAPVQVGASASIPSAPPTASTEMFRPRPWTFSLSPILIMLALACYGTSLMYNGIRLWRAGRRTKALLSSARNREVPERLALIVERCQRAFGLKSVTILYSAETSVPITVGRRAILLPEALFDSDSADLLSAAAGHEMAHIKRRDFAFNLIYELLSLPLAFHPAIMFIKRRIKETRELACDELVTERLLDASNYARSLLRLAESAMVLRQSAHTLGALDADILEERIMKLVEQPPRLSKFGKTVLLVAVLSLLTASSAVAAIYSLSIKQRAEATNPMDGDWELFLTQDGREIKGSVLARPLGLYLKFEGKRPVGSIWFPTISGVEEGLKQAIDQQGLMYGEQGLLDPSFDGRRLSFRVDSNSNGRGDLIEMALELSGENLTGRWNALSGGESGSIRGVRTQSVETLITGAWVVSLLANNGTETRGELIVDGHRGSGKPIFNIAGANKEWMIVETQVDKDRETYSFQVFNGEQTFKATLKLTNDQFEGPWKEMRAGGASGRIKLTRKK
jgi:beta-lactamase regulating signal transducer with metallopeptidase domain